MAGIIQQGGLPQSTPQELQQNRGYQAVVAQGGLGGQASVSPMLQQLYMANPGNKAIQNMVLQDYQQNQAYNQQMAQQQQMMEMLFGGGTGGGLQAQQGMGQDYGQGMGQDLEIEVQEAPTAGQELGNVVGALGQFTLPGQMYEQYKGELEKFFGGQEGYDAYVQREQPLWPGLGSAMRDLWKQGTQQASDNWQ